MEKIKLKKLVLTAVFAAVAVVGSLFHSLFLGQNVHLYSTL